jgi:hypothetical protein
MFEIVMLLLAILVIAGIAASAVQQHKAHKDAEKREELNRQRAIIDETEGALLAAEHMPLSKQLIAILQRRVANALQQSLLQSSNPDYKQRLKDTTEALADIDVTAPAPDQGSMKLPSNDKGIIQYIKAIKKLRVILRSEHGKGHITTKLCVHEDKSLESLQLRVNVETLRKRANDAISSGMHGSARQYLEKSLHALKQHKPQDEYTSSRIQEFEQTLKGLANSMKEHNLAQIAAEKAKEGEGIDDLFGPKKKW